MFSFSRYIKSMLAEIILSVMNRQYALHLSSFENKLQQIQSSHKVIIDELDVIKKALGIKEEDNRFKVRMEENVERVEGITY